MANRAKGQVVKGYRIIDFGALAYNAPASAGGLETNYIIGTNALIADPNLPITGGIPGINANIDTRIDPATGNNRVGGLLQGFTAERIQLQPTTNCLIRFDENNRIQIYLIAGNSYTFDLETYRIYAIADDIYGVIPSTPGTLYIWSMA